MIKLYIKWFTSTMSYRAISVRYEIYVLRYSVHLLRTISIFISFTIKKSDVSTQRASRHRSKYCDIISNLIFLPLPQFQQKTLESIVTSTLYLSKCKYFHYYERVVDYPFPLASSRLQFVLEAMSINITIHTEEQNYLVSIRKNNFHVFETTQPREFGIQNNAASFQPNRPIRVLSELEFGADFYGFLNTNTIVPFIR